MKIGPEKPPFTVACLTLWGECRGESFEGKTWVAAVIWNRANDHLKRGKANDIRDAIGQVCLAPHQFSCWKNGNEFLQEDPSYPSKYWDDCVLLVTKMIQGTFIPVSNATHYHATYVHPYWADKMKKIAQIGKHIFYC